MHLIGCSTLQNALCYQLHVWSQNTHTSIQTYINGVWIKCLVVYPKWQPINTQRSYTYSYMFWIRVREYVCAYMRSNDIGNHVKRLEVFWMRHMYVCNHNQILVLNAINRKVTANTHMVDFMSRQNEMFESRKSFHNNNLWISLWCVVKRMIVYT